MRDTHDSLVNQNPACVHVHPIMHGTSPSSWTSILHTHTHTNDEQPSLYRRCARHVPSSMTHLTGLQNEYFSPSP